MRSLRKVRMHLEDKTMLFFGGGENFAILLHRSM
jgi:hypothetical protein